MNEEEMLLGTINWYQRKFGKLQEIIDSSARHVVLKHPDDETQDIHITDPVKLADIKTGLVIASSLFKDFPLKEIKHE